MCFTLFAKTYINYQVLNLTFFLSNSVLIIWQYRILNYRLIDSLEKTGKVFVCQFDFKMNCHIFEPLKAIKNFALNTWTLE